jgi:hypothetical protein
MGQTSWHFMWRCIFVYDLLPWLIFIIETACVLCEAHAEARDSSYTQDSEVQVKAEESI